MLIFDIRETLEIMVNAKGALVPMAMNTAAGIRSVSRQFGEVGHASCFSRAAEVTVVHPAS